MSMDNEDDWLNDLPIWKYNKIECPICEYQWTAVYTILSDNLECPKCGCISEPIIID